MTVCVEYAVDLVDADAQGRQRIIDVRTGVHQIHASLKQDDAAHRGPVHVPAVAVAGVHHREIVASEQMLVERVRTLVCLAWSEIQVDFDALAQVGYLEYVCAQSSDHCAVADFDRIAPHEERLDEFLRGADPAEGAREFYA